MQSGKAGERAGSRNWKKPASLECHEPGTPAAVLMARVVPHSKEQGYTSASGKDWERLDGTEVGLLTHPLIHSSAPRLLPTLVALLVTGPGLPALSCCSRGRVRSRMCSWESRSVHPRDAMAPRAL